MQFTLQQIAEVINGEVCGDEQQVVHNLAKIEEGVAGTISFLANIKYTEYIYTSEATAVIVSNDFIPTKALKTTLIKVEDAYGSFAKLLDFYNTLINEKTGIAATAVIAESATIGEDVFMDNFVSIGENAVIEDGVKINAGAVIGDNVTVGENSVINSNVSINHSCKIGERAILHSGVVIGADGFGFAPQKDGTYKKIAQIGNVVVGDDVEIGANTTIDRATMGSTVIKNGVKLDNLVQIAHNVEIGENTVIASLTGVSGSTKIGRNCIFAGQVGVIGHIKIGDHVTVGAQSGVNKSVANGKTILGTPAVDAQLNIKSIIRIKNLGKLNERVDKLEKNQ